MRFYQGTMVNADMSADPNWVFIEWLYPGEKKFTAVKDVKRIEVRIKESGLRGWFAKSEKDHTTMHMILQKMGATHYGEGEHDIYFKKEVI